MGLVIMQFLTTIKLTPSQVACPLCIEVVPYVCAGEVANIERMFPGTDLYRCHCPSTTLNCTFPRSPIAAAWYVLVDEVLQNCNGYDDHFVNSTDMEMGSLVLMVNNTGVSQSNIYSCATVYGDGSSARSMPLMLPRYEGQL